MIPGSNILNMALSVIAAQIVSYTAYDKRELNANGQWITVYSPARPIRGSFQPVARTLYQRLGLDFQKQYFTFYASKDMLDVQRDVTSDSFVFCGTKYQVLSANDWFNIDGWSGVLAVAIGPPK